MSEIILALLVGLLIGKRIGWRYAHVTVANECEKLGGFYVDRKVYKCTEIQEGADQTENRDGTDSEPTTINVQPAKSGPGEA